MRSTSLHCSHVVQEHTAVLKVFGGKKTTTAVTHFKRGNSLIKVNKWSLEMIKLHTLQCKLLDPVLFLGKNWFAGRDTHTCVMCDGQWPDLCVTICPYIALVAYFQEYMDEAFKKIKDSQVP
ncbi:40S ribosomal protein S16 [Sciurus carolinensis]|uniref:Small ribosomal subunit protein uS9 n=1 Tax=Sciurus carolinensis TaxID=30640 RepID=A0AA41SUC6_SCICA|nr:40S ribosomal protein S16 [Sciurus carolinensis]